MDNVIEKLMEYQQIKKEKRKSCILILDDVKLDFKSKNLGLLFAQGRHFKICTILSVQNPKQLCSPQIRGNLDGIFLSNMSYPALKTI